ncbi:MAG: preprotein translocase subunit SecA [Anaerolineae bacterium]|nr:preprotein translocase subunit SecA [Anaerolineae bacterium]
MFRNLLSKIIGDPNERELNRLRPLVEEINALEPEFEALSDEELRGKTTEFTGRLQVGESLDGPSTALRRSSGQGAGHRLVVEAFAAVREASKRTTGMRHFDVQLMGGMVLHEGKVAEMRTGEGKTLAATLPLYLNALEGKGCHLVTVNDYLAKRDTQWMGSIYHLLGLGIGLLQGEGESFLFDPTYEKGKYQYLRPCPRKEAYLADITYGTNHEFGFDYLRDNLAYDLSRRVQRKLHYAIVDEVDYILIDEARTPLIISGPSDEPIEEYERFARIARKLQSEIDYEIDERERTVVLTDAGLAKVEKETGIESIYDEANYKYVHYMEQALKAQVLFRQGREYIKQHGRIILVDEFTGRLMPDRRLSDGLHQAIEAKEGVRVRPKMMTHATITLQNCFRLYEKLAGMTGTAATEEEEFYKIYGFEVVVIPTNRPMIRIDHPDVVYCTEKAKRKAIVREIADCYKVGRPVLVGTTSIEKSEELSRELAARGIKHQVLHAKNHTKEAGIIARAGEPGAVTVATQMAGRGVDVKLGGELPMETIKVAHRVLREQGIDPFRATSAQLNSAIAVVDPDYALRREKVLSLDGLQIIVTERHEARRIDNQLRGRSGRQGDPGSSRFYISLEDDLMRRFGGERVKGFMEWAGMEEDIPIEHDLVTKSIENAQSRVEGYNFDIRKRLLEYDDVLNRQRQLIYDQRYRILTKDNLHPDVWAMIEEELDRGLESELEFVAYLDQILPLYVASADAPFRCPYSFFGKLTCFPPFSISFLAEQMAGPVLSGSTELAEVLSKGLRPEHLRQEILEMNREATEEYREHLLEKVVGETLERVEDRYQDGLQRYAESLEWKVEDYLAWAEERGKTVGSRDLVQHLQKVFPLPLKLGLAEMRGLELEEVMERLFEALDVAYHRMICESLIKGIQARLPEAISLDNVRPSGLEGVKELLGGAVAYDEEAAVRLARVREEIERRTYRGNLANLVSEAASLASFEIEGLWAPLRQAVAEEYDRWAERQLAETERKIGARMRGLENLSVEETVQILLDVYHVEKESFDRKHRKRISFVPRLPLSFLTLRKVRRMEREELRQLALAHLKGAFAERERVWGEQELARISQQRLVDLDGETYDGLLKHLGEERIRQSSAERRIADLEFYDDIKYYLKMRQIEGQRLADLEMGEEILEHLGRQLERRSLGQKITELEEDVRQRIEDFLREQGYFEDAEAERHFLQGRLGDLDKGTYGDLAAHVGKELLGPLREKPVAELDVRPDVEDYLKGLGYFTDEEKVQQFFVHGRLGDLGEEVVRETCLYLGRERLQKARQIWSLDASTRESVLRYLEGEGLLADEAKLRDFPELRPSDLDPATYVGVARHLGSWLLGNGRIADLDDDLRESLIRHLKGHFVDRAKLESLEDRRLSELGQEIHEDVQEKLVEELKENLERPIGELGGDLQGTIRACLDEIDYFVDEAKVRSFRQQPLASLEAAVLYGLERHLGHKLMAKLGGKKFLNLDQEVRESILDYMDRKGYLKKAKTKRFIQRGSLSDLEGEMYDDVAHHLGRQLLSNVKGLYFAQLPEDMGQAVWNYLVEQGYFTDSELIQLVPLLSIAELEAEVGESIVTRLIRELEEALVEQKIADLREGLRASVQRHLDEFDYFVDWEQVRRIERVKAAELEQGIYQTAVEYLGQQLLDGRRVAELEERPREEVRSYLEEAGYFVDQAKKQRYMQMRLADLEPEIYEGLVGHLGRELEREIGEQRVAELEDEVRRTLRRYLDEAGYFVDEERLKQFGQRTLASLKTEDYQGLAAFLGRGQLDERLRVADLPQEVRESLKRYLRAEGYFLDEGKLAWFQQHRLTDLDEETCQEVLKHLRQEQKEALRERRIVDLDREMQLGIQRFLREEGFALGEAEMERFRGLKLADLESELYDGLVRYLGQRWVEEIENRRIADLDEATLGGIRAYLGQRVMHQIEKNVMLHFISQLWIHYLTDIEDLRQGIGLEAFGQRDPLVQYKIKAFEMFEELQASIRRSVVANVFRWPPQPLKLSP